MKEYLKFSLALCTFGFFKEFRPTEPFIVDYYTTNKNVTLEDVNQRIFPVNTYSYLAQIAIVFLITDYLRYKPLIIVCGMASVITWLTMLLVDGVLPLQFVEVVYGTFCATEIAYYSYIYAKTDKKYYQQVTSHTRAAIFFGRLFGSLLAQFLVYFSLASYWQLNLITFICQVIGAIWVIFFISPVKTSVYFHRSENATDKGSAFKLIWQHFKNSYTNPTVVLWSIFYTISFCLFFQYFAYIQVLWLTIEENNATWNGIVDAIYTALAGIITLLAGRVEISYLKSEMTTMLVLISLSFAQGIITYFTATSSTLVMCYTMFILYAIIYSFSITICATKIAESIEEECYGLIFGFNTFVGLIIQVTLLLTVVSHGFKLTPSGQYLVYASIYIVLGCAYSIKWIVDNYRIFLNRK